MVIEKIFSKNFDEEVHSDFLKFSRGEFKDKYLIEGKKQKDKWAIKTSAEFVNHLVKKCLKKVSGKIKVKGVIVSTLDMENEINFEIKKKSNFQGVKKLAIDTEVDVANLRDLMDCFPRVFYALSFKGDDFDIKVKAKAPKSPKPGKKEAGGPKADFCTLKTSDESLAKELFFDVGLGWTECKISHMIKVEQIVYPSDASELSPKEIREQSKRKGVLVRKIILDGSEKKNETEFVA